MVTLSQRPVNSGNSATPVHIMTNPWIERWREGRTGWHEPDGNRGLRSNWNASGRHVLVPLAGKTIDMLWLAAQGNRVTGVELSPLAVEAFFAEHELEYTIDESGALPVYAASGVDIRIACGDYFAFNETGFDGHYDRGALVALSDELRPRYAQHTEGRLSPNAYQCVITVQYDSSVAEGPPFSLNDTELLAYWPRLECRDSYDDTLNMPPKFRDAGLESIAERVWIADQ